MSSRRPSSAAVLFVMVVALSACARTSEGVPISEPSESAESVGTAAPPATPTPDDGPPAYGVVPTERAPVPAGAVTCQSAAQPAVSVLAEVTDPQAPRVTVAVPEGWGMTAGSGDVGARLTGPDGASATVTIAATQLGPEEAFRDYGDTITAEAAISSLSILPGELCAYSGQMLMGILADEPGDGISFTDHVVHVWTNAGDYLVAVHVQTPTGVEADAAAVELITDDFEIRLP